MSKRVGYTLAIVGAGLMILGAVGSLLLDGALAGRILLLIGAVLAFVGIIGSRRRR